MAKQELMNEAFSLINQLRPLLDEAERSLTSARNWGFVDLLGGGFITDLIKHSKVGKARSNMEQVNYLMQRLQTVLGSIRLPQDYGVNISRLATFADFFFDGTLADGYMTFKLLENLNGVRSLKQKLNLLETKLREYKR